MDLERADQALGERLERVLVAHHRRRLRVGRSAYSTHRRAAGPAASLRRAAATG
jgi:hypothetical protein